MRPEFRTLRADEREPFLDLVEAAFDEREVFELYLDEDPELGHTDTWVAAEGERLVSSVQIFTRRIRLRGQSVLLGGIGSVATHPDRERRGLASELLRCAIRDMRSRGMLLSLLFTGRISFYERLDWVQVPYSAWSLHGGRPCELTSRPFAAATDLEPVRELYESYNARLDGTTERDAAYWNAQLRFGGGASEDFRLALRGGQPVAYARAIDFFGMRRVIELARTAGAAGELAALVATLAPKGEALVIDGVPDPELDLALEANAERVDRIEMGERMWRVLDRTRLLELAELPDSTSDPDLLRALVGGERAAYWSSDRF